MTAIEQHAPDVVLLDVHMPDGGGVEVIRRTAAGSASPPCFLALSVSDAAEDVIAVDPRRGARLRDEEHLRRGPGRRGAPRARWRRRLLSSPGRLRARRLRRPGAPAQTELDALTPREREVLQHIARGYMYKEIALRLEISPKTVEAHVSSVLRKLQLSSRHELTRWAADRGLGSLSELVPLRHRAGSISRFARGP